MLDLLLSLTLLVHEFHEVARSAVKLLLRLVCPDRRSLTYALRTLRPHESSMRAQTGDISRLSELVRIANNWQLNEVASDQLARHTFLHLLEVIKRDTIRQLSSLLELYLLVEVGLTGNLTGRSLGVLVGSLDLDVDQAFVLRTGNGISQ